MIRQTLTRIKKLGGGGAIAPPGPVVPTPMLQLTHITSCIAMPHIVCFKADVMHKVMIWFIA